MGTRINNFHVTLPAWRRWFLLAALLVLGGGYVAAYAFFIAHSENFIVIQRNRKAMAFSAAHPLVLPGALKFGSDGDGNASLGGGWSPSMRGGASMASNDAWIMLATLPRQDADVLLALDTVVFTTRQTPTNRIDVMVNGQLLGSWRRGRLNADAPLEIQVPRTLVRDGKWQLRIHVDHIASPYRPDVGVDRNGQHVLLTGITLRQTDVAAAKPSGGQAGH